MRFFELLNKKRAVCLSFFIIFLITALMCFSLSHKEKQPLTETRFMLDTVCSISLYEWKGDGSALIDSAFGLCSSYEKKLSATVKGSDIYKINHSKGEKVKVSEDTALLLKRAIDYCRRSGGEFDITVYPLKALWNFSGDDHSIPDSQALAQAAAAVDYTRISIDGCEVTIPDGMGIDLGAIAKGFIADCLADFLRSNGVASAIIDLGGNIYALGKKSDGSNWRVGIRKPFSDVEADIVEAADTSVVTSGVYQRCFEKDGKLYHHILRASDGMPCDSGLYSVTVISESSERCDALSTICMLLGYDKSVHLLSELSDLRAVFITSDNKLLYYPPC